MRQRSLCAGNQGGWGVPVRWKARPLSSGSAGSDFEDLKKSTQTNLQGAPCCASSRWMQQFPINSGFLQSWKLLKMVAVRRSGNLSWSPNPVLERTTVEHSCVSITCDVVDRPLFLANNVSALASTQEGNLDEIWQNL